MDSVSPTVIHRNTSRITNWIEYVLADIQEKDSRRPCRTAYTKMPTTSVKSSATSRSPCSSS